MGTLVRPTTDRLLSSYFFTGYRGTDRGSGSNWIYDGGSIVRKSMMIGKPIILVTFKYVVRLRCPPSLAQVFF